MKYKVISCNVFKREIEYAAARSPHTLEIEFLELGEHARPRELRRKLQERIDAIDGFDAVLLGYGLCGTATDGWPPEKCRWSCRAAMTAAESCWAAGSGSKSWFADMPSSPFGSVGFVEHGDYYFSDGEMLFGDGYAALVEQYGEDDARYIWDAMHPKLDGRLQPITFIAIPEIPCEEAMARCRARADEEGRAFQVETGSLRLIRGLLAGNWDESEFLIVPPGRSIRQVGDWNEIIRLA